MTCTGLNLKLPGPFPVKCQYIDSSPGQQMLSITITKIAVARAPGLFDCTASPRLPPFPCTPVANFAPDSLHRRLVEAIPRCAMLQRATVGLHAGPTSAPQPTTSVAAAAVATVGCALPAVPRAVRRAYRCGNCHQVGHSRRTCQAGRGNGSGSGSSHGSTATTVVGHRPALDSLYVRPPPITVDGYIFLDVECTSSDPATGRIIRFAAHASDAELNPIARDSSRSWYVSRDHRPIMWYTQKVHGMSESGLDRMEPPSQLAAFSDFINDFIPKWFAPSKQVVLVAHNGFARDFKWLHHTLQRLGLALPPQVRNTGAVCGGSSARRERISLCTKTSCVWLCVCALTSGRVHIGHVSAMHVAPTEWNAASGSRCRAAPVGSPVQACNRLSTR